MAKASQRAGWRRSKTGPVRQENEFGSRGRERRKLLFRVSLLTTFAVALAIVLLFVLLRKPSLKVPLIVSVVSSSGSRAVDSPLYTSPNPYAAEDVDLLQAWFQGGPNAPDENVKLISDPRYCSGVMGEDKLVNQIVDPIAGATPGGPNGDMLMVYLSAHGFVDGGKPFLATGDSRADNRDSWVAFEELFLAVETALDGHRYASRGLKVVMFIDAARVGPQWDWGQFTESFAEACEQIVNRAPDRISVVLSADRGQRSWWDPRQGQGLFAAAMVDALTGSADRDENAVVTLGEVADYIGTRVRTSAAVIWDAAQSPKLIGDANRAWALINQPAKRRIAALPAVNVDQLQVDFEQINQLWKRHNRLSQQRHSPLAFDPLGWAALEKRLARLDQLVLAGRNYRDDFNALLSQCGADLTKFENGSPTLPKEMLLSELELRDYFHPIAPPTPELTATIQAWNKKPDVAAVQIPLRSTAATRFLLQWIEENRFESSAIKLADSLLEKLGLAGDARSAQFLEGHLIRLLASDDLQHLSPSQRDLVFRSQRQIREVLFSGDLRVNHWVRGRYDELNSDRLRCLDQLFADSSHSQALGINRWDETVRPQIEQLADAAGRIATAIDRRDEMLHRLPRIGETLLTDIDAFSQQEQLRDDQSRVSLRAATEATRKLIEALRLPRESSIESFEKYARLIEAADADADKAMDAVVGRLKYRIAKAVERKAGDARGLRQVLALLHGTGVDDAFDRNRIQQRLCELIRADKTAIDQTRRDVKLTQIPASEDQVWQWMAIEGRHFWDHWLATVSQPLTSVADSNQLEPDESSRIASANDTAQQSSDLVQTFHNRGGEFRKLVATLVRGELDRNLHTDTVRQSPVDRLAAGADLAEARRSLAQWDTVLRGCTVLFSHSPREVAEIGRARFELDQQLFLNDHARRTLDELWCQAKPGDRAFCVFAADQLLGSRNQNVFYGDLPAKLSGQDLNQRVRSTKAAIESVQTLRPEPSEDLRDGTLLKFVADREIAFFMTVPDSLPPGIVTLASPESGQTTTKALADSKQQRLSIGLRFPKQLPDDASAFNVDLFFRGLRRGGQIKVNDLVGGRRLVYERADYGPPIARVTRTLKEPERLLLVVDCSGSMRTSTAGSGLSRLDVARNALIQFLNGLDPQVEVGLIVFGSRFGFVEKQGQIFPVIDNGEQQLAVEELRDGRRTPVGLIRANEGVRYNPNFDVRLVRQTSPVDTDHLDALKNEINDLGAIGVTPTYLAIQKAYETLGTKPGHIIVLTDGKPKVVSTPDLVVNDGSNLAINLANSRRDDIQLTIVKYLDQDTELRRQFPHAKVLDAADGQSLLRYLQDISIKPVVTWQRRRQPASREAAFGDLISIATWPPDGADAVANQPVLPAERYSIRAVVPDSGAPIDESSEVRVEGGERFELQLDETRLVHRPFEYQGSLIRDRLQTEKADAARFIVHSGPMGKRFNRQLALQIAIESATNNRSDGKFTPRPSDVWIEVRGIDRQRRQQGRQQVSFFGLPEFKAGQPIPILLCKIDNFPQQFDQVDVKAWMRFADRPLEGAPLSVSEAKAITIESIPGVSFRTEKTIKDDGNLSVVVTEAYRDERTLATVRVLPSPLPEKSATVIYDDLRVVVREFEYSDVATNVKLSVTDSEEIKTGSTLYAEGNVSIDIDSR
ncbi:vWA domain-containing protein [Roseiconus lacunae]|uniref:vWA domain-containing protein n=1 Tax=Roseiconus lacunae TaxID=2605694 RepID=UPI0011F0C4AA|nr:VWA domain-containing protein [Roseiconus lacunae]